jgi:hypothetical protein
VLDRVLTGPDAPAPDAPGGARRRAPAIRRR